MITLVADKELYKRTILYDNNRAHVNRKWTNVGQPMAKPPSPPASHAAPRLVEPMKDREVREGEPVQFQCRIVAVPDPFVQWFYNNQIIKPSKYFQLSADPASGCYGLSIAGVFPEDDGAYKCVARNPVGEVACIAQLRVVRK